MFEPSVPLGVVHGIGREGEESHQQHARVHGDGTPLPLFKGLLWSTIDVVLDLPHHQKKHTRSTSRSRGGTKKAEDGSG